MMKFNLLHYVSFLSILFNYPTTIHCQEANNNNNGEETPILSSTIEDNNVPVIGVLTQPVYGMEEDVHYIAASYIKWIESAGGMAIPIPQNADNETIVDIFSQINGVLLTGGADTDPFVPDTVKKLWELAMDENDDVANDGHFPIWATCLGFEMVVAHVSQRGKDVLQTNFTTENMPMPLVLTEEAFSPSFSMFSSDQAILQMVSESLSTDNKISMNNHHMAIQPNQFQNDPDLNEMFAILSTNQDPNTKDYFVSSIQARHYPFFAVQWHPEKNLFEYSTVSHTNQFISNNPHTEDAIRLSTHVANVFLHEARKNKHVYTKVDQYPSVYEYATSNGIHQYFEEKFVIPVTKTGKRKSVAT